MWKVSRWNLWMIKYYIANHTRLWLPMGLEYQWKTIFDPQTIIHPPILHGSAGKCWLNLQAQLVCGLTDQPVTMTGLPLQALRFVVSRAPWSPGAPGHPEPTREGCSLTSSPLERSQIRRLVGFAFPWPKDLEGRINSFKARGRECCCADFHSSRLNSS
jgi:hypothetical protein